MTSRKLLLFLGFFLLFLGAAPVSADTQERYGIYQSDQKLLSQILNGAEADLAKDPGNTNALKRAGIASHQLALFYGEDYAKKALIHLQAIVDKDRNDAVAMAYLGSSYALVARDASVIMDKVSNVNKGLSLVNRAVRTAPQDFVVRMVRGSVIFELPAMFKKAELAIEDFSYVESRFDNLPDIKDIDVPMLKAEVYYKLGSLIKEKGDKDAASTYFKKSVDAAPASQWARLAKKE